MLNKSESIFPQQKLKSNIPHYQSLEMPYFQAFSQFCIVSISLLRCFHMPVGIFPILVSKTMFRQISIRFYKVTTVFKSDRQGGQNDHGAVASFDHRVQMPLRGRSKVTAPPPTGPDSHTVLAQPQKQTRDSDNTQCAGIPCFQRFSRYSVHSLCIN